LDEGKRNGIKVTLAKYSLFPATFYYWRKKFNVYGEEGLTHPPGCQRPRGTDQETGKRK
jgi:hypothetical protein